MASEKPTVPQRLRTRRRPGDERATRGAHDVAAPVPARASAAVAPGESSEPSWRASSYDLKHGLEVIELPSSLPPDVLDRLFNAPR